jgi:hypothetical protein
MRILMMKKSLPGKILESYNKNNFFFQSHNSPGSFGSMA